MVTEMGASEGFSRPCSAFSRSSLNSSGMCAGSCSVSFGDFMRSRARRHDFGMLAPENSIASGSLSGFRLQAFATARRSCGQYPASVWAAETNMRLKLRGRQKNAALEHAAEKCGEAFRVALLAVGVIRDRLARKEKREQRTRRAPRWPPRAFRAALRQCRRQGASSGPQAIRKIRERPANRAKRSPRSSPADCRKAFPPDRPDRAARRDPSSRGARHRPPPARPPPIIFPSVVRSGADAE